MVLHRTYYESPCGTLSLVSEDERLRGIWFLGQKYFEQGIVGDVDIQIDNILRQTIQLLDAYFRGENPDFSHLPLANVGTNFQQRVWRILMDIPLGETKTYGELAQYLGMRSAQAVGGAVRYNPWSIIVPCHRVLGKGGRLTGYAGGLENKKILLRHEGIKSEE